MNTRWATFVQDSFLVDPHRGLFSHSQARLNQLKCWILDSTEF
jgi:hypothetical protein